MALYCIAGKFPTSFVATSGMSFAVVASDEPHYKPLPYA
jgi:hypothetical protein